MSTIAKVFSETEMALKWPNNFLLDCVDIKEKIVLLETTIPIHKEGPFLGLFVIYLEDGYFMIHDDCQCFNELLARGYGIDEIEHYAYINGLTLDDDENHIYAMFTKFEELYGLIEKFAIFVIDVTQKEHFHYVMIECNETDDELNDALDKDKSRFSQSRPTSDEDNSKPLYRIIRAFYDQFHLVNKNDNNHHNFYGDSLKEIYLIFSSYLDSLHFLFHYPEGKDITVNPDTIYYPKTGGTIASYQNEIPLVGLKEINISDRSFSSIVFNHQDPLLSGATISYKYELEKEDIPAGIDLKEYVLFSVPHKHDEENLESLISNETETIKIRDNLFLIKKSKSPAYLRVGSRNVKKTITIKYLGLDIVETKEYFPEENVEIKGIVARSNGLKRDKIKFFDKNHQEFVPLKYNYENDLFKYEAAMADVNISFVMPHDDMSIEVTYIEDDSRAHLEFDLSAIKDIFIEEYSNVGTKHERFFYPEKCVPFTDGFIWNYLGPGNFSINIALKGEWFPLMAIITYEDGRVEQRYPDNSEPIEDDDGNDLGIGNIYCFETPNGKNVKGNIKIFFKY